MLLLARELDAHRVADRARQQHGIGRHVVGAVAAVATGGFQPDHVDLRLGQREQQREVGAQPVRILRARPHPHARFVIVRDRAGWADRAVHLVRPDVSALHRSVGRLEGGVDVALVEQDARRGRIGAQRGLDVLQVGQRRHRFPDDLELRRCLDRVFLALGDDADEVADPDDSDQPGDVAD